MGQITTYHCDACKKPFGDFRHDLKRLCIGLLEYKSDYSQPQQVIDVCSECLMQYTQMIDRWLAGKK